jgi:ComF family protein
VAVDVLVPVPLAPARRRQRGFNQAELIARGVGARLGWPVDPSLLVRVRETPQQIWLPEAERRTNVEGAFGCPNPDAVDGRRVVLVDDVMTTGSTLRACAEPLKLAGALRVYGLVVARNV